MYIDISYMYRYTHTRAYKYSCTHAHTDAHTISKMKNGDGRQLSCVGN